MATKSISQLTSAISVDNETLIEAATPDENSASGYASEKVSVAQLADHNASAVVYPALNTTTKTLIGAINEVLSGNYEKVDVTTLDAGEPDTGAGGGVYYEKYGEIVHLHLAVRLLTAGTNTAVMMLPSGFRPPTTIIAIGIGGNVSDNYKCTATIASDGTVYLYSANASYQRADIVFIAH